MNFYLKNVNGTYQIQAKTEQDAMMQVASNCYYGKFDSMTFETPSQLECGSYHVSTYDGNELIKRFGE